MNQFRLLYFSLLAVLFLSCREGETFDSPLRHFEHLTPRKLEVSQYINLEKYDVYRPGDVIKSSGGYVIQDHTSKNLISYIDILNNIVFHGINKGEAPGEVLSVGRFQKSGDDFFVYDVMRKVVYKINIDLDSETIFLSEHRKINILKRLFSTFILPNGIISAGIFENGWLESYNENDSLVSFIPFPDFKETEGLTAMEKSAIYISSTIVASPDFTKIVCAPQNAGVISFMNLKGNSVEEYKRLIYNPPLVRTPRTEGATAIVYDWNSMLTFSDVICENEFVLALYSGRTHNSHGLSAQYGEHVLMYSWDGIPMQHFVLEKPLSSLKYDRDNKVIYGIGYDPEGVIIEYDLNSALID